MTEPEARTAKISEVWVEFQTVAVTIERSSRDGDFTEAAKKHLRKCLELAKPKFDMLRAVLLERCEKIMDSKISPHYTYFGIQDDVMVVRNWGNTIERHTPETALEMSASYAFWAWELKQRENELQKG